jgi:hypothetical protein
MLMRCEPCGLFPSNETVYFRLASFGFGSSPMSHQALNAELASSIEDSRVANDKKRFAPISHQTMRQCKTSRTHARVETNIIGTAIKACYRTKEFIFISRVDSNVFELG